MLRSINRLVVFKMGFHRSYFQIFTICLLALIQSCLASTENQTRILGGNATTIDKIPYLVYLRDHAGFVCAGSLVNESYIVTAAHCFVNRPPIPLTAIAGTGKLSGKGVRSQVVKIMRHRDYDAKTLHMDVAVLKLKTPLNGTYISPIGLCNTGWSPGASLQVSGWGKLAENFNYKPNQVHTVNVTSMARSACAVQYGNIRPITRTMFCTLPGSKGTCFGDSGGPAVLNGRLCGIVSGGYGCGGRYPYIFTNVNLVKTFIQNAMKK